MTDAKAEAKARYEEQQRARAGAATGPDAAHGAGGMVMCGKCFGLVLGAFWDSHEEWHVQLLTARCCEATGVSSAHERPARPRA